MPWADAANMPTTGGRRQESQFTLSFVIALGAPVRNYVPPGLPVGASQPGSSVPQKLPSVLLGP